MVKNMNDEYKNIDIDEIKARYISELVSLFYRDILLRFPDSIQIQLLANHYALAFKRKEMLCLFQLRNFNYSKLSKLD